MDKNEIIAILEDIATLMELKGENPFKVRAYRTAARNLENVEEDLESVAEENRLHEIPGIGKAIEEKITTLLQTDQLPFYEDLKNSIPPGLLEILNVPGLGSKKINVLYKKLKITSLDKLKKACEKGKVRKLAGFGEKTEANILDGIAHLEQYSKRTLWWSAMVMVQPIVEKLKKLKQVQEVKIAGSLRRKLETVGDFDILIASSNPEPIMDWFTSQDFVESVIAKGSTKSSIRLNEGIQADIRIVPKEQFGFALLYFTGSKEHSIRLRQIAKDKGYSLNEYALTPLKKKLITETDIYRALGLTYIPPELRENHGEIEAAQTKGLPHLIEESDIRGVFHNHTTASDGHNTLEQMVKGAEELGWEYLGIADHSKSSFQANGLDEESLLEQIDQIKKINRSKKYKTHIFSGTECDILKNGNLDYADEILKQLDYVVVSVHTRFKLDEKEMTKRIIKALENPYTTMLGHMTGRLLLRREPYLLNTEKIIDAAIANGKIIELNANPQRLDMDWRLWHRAKEKGLKCSINPDAHSVEGLEFFRAGVNIARKGWLTKDDVLNAWPLSRVKKYLSQS
ncbi:MAG: DNA polymerase/3'-5' exonuclease PolX [Chlamydiae bacterium]|nr:DNA polymerase/3'-5' exonuclease PolX [Chlamydiota bacterium]